LRILAFRRTGGFAGNLPALSLDATALPAEQTAELERLLATVELPREPSSSRGAPDAFRYELELERTGKRERLDLGERDIPPELRPLLTELTRLARESRRSGRR
jgi:hypothetical protein